MKITRKILEKIIKQEIAKVLAEAPSVHGDEVHSSSGIKPLTGLEDTDAPKKTPDLRPPSVKRSEREEKIKALEAQIEAEMATSSSMGARGDASASQSQASKMAGYNAAHAASLSSNYVNSSSFVEVSFNTTRINETAVDGRAGADEDAGLLEADTGAAVSTASSSNIDLVRSFSDVGGTGTGTGTGGDENLAST